MTYAKSSIDCFQKNDPFWQSLLFFILRKIKLGVARSLEEKPAIAMNALGNVMAFAI